jgi:transposase
VLLAQADAAGLVDWTVSVDSTINRAINAPTAHAAGHAAGGGRPVSYDHETYKGRTVVERSFVRLKQWRGLATRYDKLAIVYRAAAVLAAAITWLRHIGDTSRPNTVQLGLQACSLVVCRVLGG